MIDATHLKAHRTAASLLKKGMFPVVSGEPRGGLNSKLHTVCDGDGRPIVRRIPVSPPFTGSLTGVSRPVLARRKVDIGVFTVH